MSYEEMMKIAKGIMKILKREEDAVMVANRDFERVMVNFLITDGELAVGANFFEEYFIVNDGDREIFEDAPCLKGARRQIYDLGLSFLKNHTYTVG